MYDGRRWIICTNTLPAGCISSILGAYNVKHWGMTPMQGMVGDREGGCIERRDTGCCAFLVTGSIASLDHRAQVGVLGVVG